jgi:ribosomal protein L40E
MGENNKKYSSEQEAVFRAYHNKIISMLLEGKRFTGGIFPNKPQGFMEWLKEHPELKIGLTKRKEVELKICWNCQHKYPIDHRKCPRCKKFNPDANKNP